jgi:hypothetical protein
VNILQALRYAGKIATPACFYVYFFNFTTADDSFGTIDDAKVEIIFIPAKIFLQQNEKFVPYRPKSHNKLPPGSVVGAFQLK